MIYKLLVNPGSYHLAMLIEKGLNVYSSKESDQITYFLASTPEMVELHSLQNLVKDCDVDVDVAKLVLVKKPTSVMGRWAFHLVLNKKQE